MKLKKTISGNCYSTLKYLQNLKKVVAADLLDTMNTSGNWGGYFIIKNKKDFSIYFFNQEKQIKQSPISYYDLYYDLRIKTAEMPSDEDLNQLYYTYCN
jgi:hypothetical protein